MARKLDPSKSIMGGPMPMANIHTATSISAVKFHQYFLMANSAVTLTLPATPNTGDAIWITVANGLANNIIDRNGEKIMGISENMTIDSANVTVQLRYANTAMGWRIT